MEEHYTQRHYEDFDIKVVSDKTKPIETLFITDGLNVVIAVEDIDRFLSRIQYLRLVERGY